MIRASVLILSLAAGAFGLTGPRAAFAWAQASAAGTQFVRERVDDGRYLLFGPHAPTPPSVRAGQSCAELYAQRLRLMQTQNDYTPPYTDDPRNRAAIFIGTIFTPAFSFLAFTGIQAYTAKKHEIQTQAEIDALRHASAQQQCYVR
jgi:hypothetical protein